MTSMSEPSTPQGGGSLWAQSFCEHFITQEELGSDDPWAGTYCKLRAGHVEPHSALYPDERRSA